jgi:hypothetical protein
VAKESLAHLVLKEFTVRLVTGEPQPFCKLEADMKGLIGFIRDTVILCALLLKRTFLRLCGRADVVPVTVEVGKRPTDL